MRFFHFTPLANYQLILQSDSIRPGNTVMPDCSVAPESAVSLTKAVTPIGLGIPTGRLIPRETFALLVALGPPHDAHRLENGNAYQLDHSQVRLRVEIPMGDNLKSAKSFYKQSLPVLASLAASASEPFGISHFTEAQKDILTKRTTPNKVAALTKDWWYYFGKIPVHWIDQVALKDAGGNYKVDALPMQILAAKRAASGGSGL